MRTKPKTNVLLESLARRKRTKRTARTLLAIALLSFLFGQTTYAHDPNQAVDLEDFGFTMGPLTGARPAGLAGAYTAVGGDVHSLLYNPAGLADTRRIELSLGFLHESFDNTERFFGVEGETEFSATNLDFLGAAYPFPTYRGSLVGAFAVYRDYSSDLDLFYDGFNSKTVTRDTYVLEQSGSVFSYNFGFGVDLSPQISAGGSFFILDAHIKALTQWSYEFPGPFSPGDLTGVFLDDDVEVDLDGYGARLGILVHAAENITVGLAVKTPTWISLSGDGFTSTTEYYDSTPDSIIDEYALIEVDYRLPFQVDAGVALRIKDRLLLSVDAGFVDWTEATINKTQLKIETSPLKRKPVFRRTFNLRAGLEATLPGVPIRLRGGYAYIPYPLAYLQADRITNDQLRSAEIERERQVFSLGVGGLAGKVLALDFAFVYRTGKRSIDTMIYEENKKSFLLSAAYRF